MNIFRKLQEEFTKQRNFDKDKIMLVGGLIVIFIFVLALIFPPKAFVVVKDGNGKILFEGNTVYRIKRKEHSNDAIYIAELNKTFYNTPFEIQNKK